MFKDWVSISCVLTATVKNSCCKIDFQLCWYGFVCILLNSTVIASWTNKSFVGTWSTQWKNMRSTILPKNYLTDLFSSFYFTRRNGKYSFSLGIFPLSYKFRILPVLKIYVMNHQWSSLLILKHVSTTAFYLHAFKPTC